MGAMPLQTPRGLCLRLGLLALPLLLLATPGRAAPPPATTARGFTVVVRVQMNSLKGAQTFVRQGTLALGKTGDGDRFALTVSPARATPVAAQSDFSPTLGLWYDLAGVCDEAGGQIRLYANGVRLASAPYHGSGAGDGSTDMGTDTPGAAQVQGIHFYRRALTDADVARLAAEDRARREPGTFTWANPVYFQGDGPGDDIHDPQIYAEGGVYYLVATLAPFRNYTDRDPKLPDLGSSPGISLYASRDLKVWTFQRWLLKSSELPDDCPYKHQFWAPELHKLGHRYYLIFGGSNWLDDKANVGGRMGYYQFVGVADTVTGPYRHFVALRGPGVDTSLFEDDDGKTYAVWPGNEIHPIDLSQINQDKITVGPPVSRAAGPDDYKALGLPVPGTMEGPYLIKRTGTYYCFFATTYPDLYATGLATAKSLTGPWTLDPRTRQFPCGHQAEFVGPDGRWWMAYKHERSPTTPWLSVDPIDFDAQGKVQMTPTTGPQSLRAGP